MRAWSRHRRLFLQTFCPYKYAILDLSILFKANYPVIFALNYPVTKSYPVSFFVKKTCSCQFQNKKRFCFSNKKSSGEFSCPYKFGILWRHIFDWHEIGTRILNLLILWVKQTTFSSTCNAALFRKNGYGKKNGRGIDLSRESCTLEGKATKSAEWLQGPPNGVWIWDQARGGHTCTVKNTLRRVGSQREIVQLC